MLVVTAFVIFLLSILIFLLVGWICHCATVVSEKILIIVLGDVGRSPRMQYHALSFAKEGYAVDLVGFDHSPLITELQNESLVTVVPINEPPKKPTWLPQLVYYILKTTFLSVQLILRILLKTSKHSHILVQNPPAIPTLAVAWLISIYRQSKFIIDWHNYGYTILSLAVGSRNLLVQFSKFYEGILGRRATLNVCVTKAMRHDLKQRWGVDAITLYDRPPQMFKSVDENERHRVFLKLSKSYDVFKSLKEEETKNTRFTTISENGKVTLRRDRPAMLISSTSWTEDEDFGILLNALVHYDKMVDIKCPTLPNIVCVITGKGPLKAFFQGEISKIKLNHVEICTPWLEADDYPVLVGSADLGICLHMSSSGLDLPMKIVDMFGCGVPVCAINFPCLNELVNHGVNGMVFNGDVQLAEQLEQILVNFPRQHLLENFRRNLKNFQEKRWHASWREAFFEPVFM